jgi:hypothetical protein
MVDRRRILLMGGNKIPSFPFDYSKTTFTAAMAKRNSAGPFAAGVVSQGNRAASASAMDVVSYTDGTKIAGTYFYPRTDYSQGTVVFWVTPEWNGNEAVNRLLWGNVNAISVSKTDSGLLLFRVNAVNIHYIDISAWTAGTTYCVAISWDIYNPIDGTNFARISVNDVHSFGRTSTWTPVQGDGYIGGMGATWSSANALIEGLTVYRRCLYDGAYGVNVNNGDELNLIFAAGAGADPCTITGSWDVCLCVPTNSTVGALATGTGEAWSHPHSSNLLTDGWLQSYYGNQWGVKLNGTTAYVNCGSDAGLDNLADNEFTAEIWARLDASGTTQILIDKGRSTAGWVIYYSTTGGIWAELFCATTSCAFNYATSLADGKWHHLTFYFNDAGDRKIYFAVDGVWQTASGAGVGAIVSDAANSLTIGRRSVAAAEFMSGCIGWTRISNNDRYTHGTNFKPTRIAPVTDANTIALWQVDEGTGNTLDNDEGTAGRDGTITNGTWQPQWYPEGTPIIPTSVQGSANYVATITAAATINNLADNAFTVEGWWRATKEATLKFLCYKGDTSTTGWKLYFDSSNRLTGTIYCATSPAYSIATATTSLRDGRWHYFKMTFDDAGDRKVYLYVDNVACADEVAKVAGVGAIVADAAQNGFIGHATNSIIGAHGWIAWSNVVRGAGMISRYAGRAVDGNTMVQFEATTGAGAQLTDTSGNANHGAMAGTYSWVNTGAMDVDSPSARVYGWGDARGSDAVNEGEKITYTGLTAGANYVLRALAYSEDGVGIPRVVVYDETNAAQITAITGLATSTEWTPDVLLFSFELPTNARGAAADCTSISLKRISTTAGNVGWHQIELYANLLDNPSLDVGAVADPWIPYGWTDHGLDAGDTEIEIVVRHSEGSSMQWNAGAASPEYIHATPAMTNNKYYGVGLWGYGDAAKGVGLAGTVGDIATQAARSAINLKNITAAWVHKPAVAVGYTGGWFPIVPEAAAGIRYLDDLYLVLLDDVTLTVTPASQANSLEGTGIRVDGLDRLTQPITTIQAGKGSIKFYYTPRHSAATPALFGNATPAVCSLYADANNYILLDWSAANTMRLRYNAGGVGVQTGTWNATGLIVAGTLYAMEIRYTGGGMSLYVNGASVLTISANVAFTVVPTTAYWGSDNSTTQQNDVVIS